MCTPSLLMMTIFVSISQCLYYVPEPVSYATANEFCQSFGSDLASIGSAQDRDDASLLMTEDNSVWTGLYSNSKSGNWRFNNGEACTNPNTAYKCVDSWLYRLNEDTEYRPRCITNDGSDEGGYQCSYFDSIQNGMDNDKSCDEMLPFVCDGDEPCNEPYPPPEDGGSQGRRLLSTPEKGWCCICSNIPPSRGKLTFDESCKGLTDTWVIGEADNAVADGNVETGKKYFADGFQIGNTLYKVDGSTCAYVFCKDGKIDWDKTWTCVNLAMKILKGVKHFYQQPVGLWAPPKGPTPGAKPNPLK